MTVNVNLGEKSYDVIIEKGVFDRAGEELNLNRRVLIVTDSGVPREYAEGLAQKCKAPVIAVIKSGENHKNLRTMETLFQKMLDSGFTRKDCVVAIGGGIVGDLAGFTAASYMRGIDFYNIPTTVLSCVDSSVGGKTAVNFGNVKNIIGAFWQPKKVLIDVSLLKTLPARQISNGLSEAVKMALTFDREFFEIFKSGIGGINGIGEISGGEKISDEGGRNAAGSSESVYSGGLYEASHSSGLYDEGFLEKVIARSVQLKADVVEKDEREAGLRKVLNFGHTIGHGIELCSRGKLYHGECVALGMLCMCSDEVRKEILPVLEKLHLPVKIDAGLHINPKKALECVSHDKKGTGDKISCVLVEKAGSFEMKDMSLEEIGERMKAVLES